MSDKIKDGKNKTEEGISRRDFLKVVGVAGGAAAASGGCSFEPVEQIIPYVIPPENSVPGIPDYYSSTCRECPAGCGIVVKTREGRAIKIEGAPENPINSGALCARGQASPQGLYNPDRVKSPLLKNEEGKFRAATWKDAEKALADRIQDLVAKGRGDRIVYLDGVETGSYDELLGIWADATGARRYHYETFSHEPIKKANEIVFGADSVPAYKIEEAEYLLSFGADYLETWLSPVSGGRGLGKLRSIKDGKIGKVVQVEARMSMTGASADRMINISPGSEVFLALGIANAMAKKAANVEDYIASLVSDHTPEEVSRKISVPAETIYEIAEEMLSKKSLAIGGGAAGTASNATEMLVAVNLLNHLSGNMNETVDFSDALAVSKSASYGEMLSLIKDMEKGAVEVLIVRGINPAFVLPRAAGFKKAMEKVAFSVSFSPFMDETAGMCSAVLPDNHPLESWGDFRARESFHGIVQPAVERVFNTKSSADVLISVSGLTEATKGLFASPDYYSFLRDYWKRMGADISPEKPFEDFWNESLKKGGVSVPVQPEAVSISGRMRLFSFSGRDAEFEGDGNLRLMPFPSAKFYDGRGANKPWLQELPDSLTSVVWDSWVEMHPSVAEEMGARDGSFVKVESPFGSFETQAFVHEGISPDTVAMPIGLGHDSYGRYAKGRGVSPMEILSTRSDALSGGYAWLSTKVRIIPTGRDGLLVRTQYTKSQHGREVAQTVDIKDLGHKHDNGHDGHGHHPDFYPDLKYEKYRWGMSIDLSKCTGCGACVTACYAENNIPFVGKEQVARRREMAWLRIDRFFEKNPDGEVTARFVPVPCQHCGNAPCEPVCPVYATYHNHEGLNGMIYNRCVGTRYCSNNCTYKVRRFNWYSYKVPEPLNWQFNPDVTVRTKGVMEKCSFCVQRIRQSHDTAKDEGRDIRDGEVVTACQQTCATNAIEFGNLLDPNSRVSEASHDERGYKLFEEINTKPAVTYLKDVTQS
ncbi:MAG: molybdopterin-dependent oxidoreductase [Candidatus Dadabacteria bacterium]|nr:molybdopterin-dependent oxidoreductase [Candidatus Dadabacteria bacterium]